MSYWGAVMGMVDLFVTLNLMVPGNFLPSDAGSKYENHFTTDCYVTVFPRVGGSYPLRRVPIRPAASVLQPLPESSPSWLSASGTKFHLLSHRTKLLSRGLRAFVSRATNDPQSLLQVNHVST